MSEESHSLANTSRGMRDAFTGRIGQQVLQFGLTIALARLLEPQDFGVVALCGVVTGFVLLMGDLGTTALLIQRRDLSPRLLTSVWTLNVVVGLGAAAVLFLLAGPLAVLLGNADAGPVMRGLALVFPIRSIAMVPMALLQRRLRFGTLARSEVLGTFLGGGAAVMAALGGWGAWALVVQQVAAAAVASVIMIVGARWIPRARPSAAELRGIARFTANLSAFNVVNYAARSGDNFLIGRFLGAGSLGIYDVAYRTVLYPLRNVSNVVSSVAFPVLSRRQDDDPALVRGYLRTVRSICLVTFPMMAILSFLSQRFVGVVYGARWAEVGPILAILGPVGMLQTVTTTLEMLFQAKGRTDLLLRLGVVESLVIVGGFIIGLRWGVRGVAISYLVTNLLMLYPVVHISMRTVHARASDFFAVTWRPALISAASGALAYVVGLSAPINASAEFVQLVGLSAVGAIAYVLLVRLFLKDDLDWMLQRVREALGR